VVLTMWFIFLLVASPMLALAVEKMCDEGTCPDISAADIARAGALLQVHSAKAMPSDAKQARGQVQARKVSPFRQQQQQQKQSLELDKRLAAAAKQLPEGVSKKFLETFKICGQCKNFKRFGEANDGGYLMCMDGLQEGVGAAYSLGVEQHDKWSADVVSTLGITVNQFDCTVEVPASDCAGCKFFKKCIVSADGENPVPGHEDEGWSLKQALKETSQESAADGSLLMKMDIESSEWPIYASESPDVLKKFGELIVEFHGLQDEYLNEKWNHAVYLKAMEHILAAGFKVAHLHGNNYQDMYEVGDTTIPKVLEVTFIHGAARPDGCSSSQIYHDLDAPNNGGPELPMAHIG